MGDFFRALLALFRRSPAPAAIGATPPPLRPAPHEDAPAQPPPAVAAPVPGKATAKKGAIPAAALLIIMATMKLEGGYVNNRNDPGGETDKGITKRVAVANGYTGPMRTLPDDVAESIYYQQYMVKPGYAPLIPIDAPVTAELFDTAVNMGPPRPSRWFQQSIVEICGARVTIDGQVGAATITAYRTCQTRLGATKLCVTMLNSLDTKQEAEYRRLVANNPNLRVFLKGWLKNRINNVDRRQCAVPAGN